MPNAVVLLCHPWEVYHGNCNAYIKFPTNILCIQMLYVHCILKIMYAKCLAHGDLGG